MRDIVAIASDNLVTLTGFADSLAGFVNTADVSGDLIDAVTNTNLITVSMPLVGPSGTYQGQIPAATTGVLVQGQDLIVQVTASYSGLKWTDRIYASADYVSS